MKNRLECMQPIRFLVVLLMCCLSYTTWAQTQSNVNGLVTDFSGEPLIGVSILVKGTSNGTVTDLVWGIERSGFFNGREKWAKGFENQRV